MQSRDCGQLATDCVIWIWAGFDEFRESGDVCPENGQSSFCQFSEDIKQLEARLNRIIHDEIKPHDPLGIVIVLPSRIDGRECFSIRGC
jgi:hypothetical protein